FNVFRKGKRGYLGPGIYLTDKEWYAQGYSEKNGPGGQMYALYARMEKPLYVTSLVEPAKEILRAAYGSRADGIYRKRQAANEKDT
ncbi:MAG: hypothetical protein IJ461_00340, partial [Clostridia bacterium]|nr:hypothetical protein [Clostridia bacterium]